MSRRRLWWLAACLFAVHNGEEIVAGPPMPPALLPVAIGEREFAIGAIAVTMIAFAVTAWVGRYSERRLACWSMLLLQSVILLNVAVHLFFSVFVGGYTSGVVSAVLLNLPMSAVHLRRAWRESWLRRGEAIASFPAAVFLHGPMLVGLMVRLSG